MKNVIFILAFASVFALGYAFANTQDDLIRLDKEWGVANLKADESTLDRVYHDDMIAVTPGWIGGKKNLLEGLEPAENTDYKTSDYTVMMLDDDTAVMAHNGGDNQYRSLHVWAKKGDNWVVMATATVPVQ